MRYRVGSVVLMGSGVRLGRIAGIEVSVNWSWLVVFALIVWSLASGVFPSTNPHLSAGAHVAMAVVAALAFFASLLLHELGHATVARREGMEIDGITLWLFGGVARFKGMFPSAGAEFRIAVAGPLVSLVLGASFVLLTLSPVPSAVDGVLAWLGYINLVLLAFNMLPALPLDGGRVLRSALWQATGDFVGATRKAARIGRGFAYLFIVGGLLLLIFQGSFSGAWLAFIGWFLLQAAGAEERYTLASEALAGLCVRDVMTPDPVTTTPDLTLGQFVDEVVRHERHHTYPVVEHGRPIGLLPFRLVAEVPRAEWDVRRVRQCMIGLDRVPVLREDEPAADALMELGSSSIGRVLVVENDRLVGLVSIRDVAWRIHVPPAPRDGWSSHSFAPPSAPH